MDCKYKSRVWYNGWCKVACMYCTLTQEMNCKHNKKTNADRIRAMSDDELADFIYRCEMSDIDYARTFCDLCNGQYECGQCRLDWLRKPMEVET